MLFKAHRFRSMRDTYNVAAPILKTLTRDRGSYRVHEIKADEEAPSIYDDIHHEGTRFQLRGQDMQIMEKPPKFLFYTDGDALEDKVLFPEEALGEGNGFAVVAEMNKMEKLNMNHLTSTDLCMTWTLTKRSPAETSVVAQNMHAWMKSPTQTRTRMRTGKMAKLMTRARIPRIIKDL